MNRKENIISVVIPALNEEKSIGNVISEIPEEIDGRKTEIIVIDDGSSDNTVEIAKKTRAKVFSHKITRGYGAALSEGFKKSKGDIIGFLDADGTYHPKDLSKLYNKLKTENLDLVVGSRLLSKKSEMPPIRRIGNKFFAFMVSRLTKAKVSDPASGMRIFRKEILTEIHPLSDELNFTPEMTTKAVQIGLKYGEVPIEYRERSGESKLNIFKDGYRFFTIIVRTVRDYNPMAVFGTLGIVTIILGSALGFYVVADFFVRGVEHSYTIIISTLMIMSGIQFLLFGFLADMILIWLSKLHNN